MQAYDATADTALINQVQLLKISPDSSLQDAATLAEIKNSITKKIADVDKAKQGLNDVMPLTWKKR